MPTKIFLGNIADFTEDTSIRQLFEEYGAVTECDILGNFGFVHMEVEEEAKQAIAGINGRTIQGRQLNVELSTNPSRGGRGRGRGGGRGDGRGEGRGGGRGGGRGYGGGKMMGGGGFGRGRGFGPPGRGRGSAFDYPPRPDSYLDRGHYPPPPPYDRYDPYGRDPYERYEDYYRSRAYAEAYERRAYGRYSPPPYERRLYPGRERSPMRDPYARAPAEYYDARSYYEPRGPY